MSSKVKESKVPAHVLTDVGPDRQQDALPFVLAGPVLVGTPEVAGHDGPVHGAHDLTERDLLGRAGQDVAAAHAALGADQPGAFEGEEDLLEVGLGQSRPLRDVAHRRRALRVVVQRQRQEGAAGVVAAGRDLHAPMLPVRLRRTG